jgi:hypothetical protein
VSTSTFMHGGDFGELVREYEPGNPYNLHIQIFEIDEPNFVGVVYGKGDKQVQPRSWWKGRIPERVVPEVGFKLQARKHSAL